MTKTVQLQLNELAKKVDLLSKRVELFINEEESPGITWTKIGNLEWSDILGDEMAWDEANIACEKIGGHLPTRLEWVNLIDNHKEDIPKDWNTLFYYWSSTEFSATYAWYVALNSGYTVNGTKPTAYYVRCVRPGN